MRVAFITGGFPSKENPMHGIFNYRAVKGIQSFADVEVFRIRMWRPMRKLLQVYEFDNIKVNELYLPMFPYSKNSLSKNVVILKYLGWPILGKKLKGFDIIHSVGVSLSGIAASYWGERAGIKHITQAIGSDLIFQIPRLKDKPFVRGWDNWVHGVSCNAEFLRNLFKKRYPGVPNVLTIYRGTDLSVFSPQGPVIESIKNLEGTKFLFIGGFPNYPDIPFGDNLKGGRTLLKAWSIVDKKMDSYFSPPFLILAGPGSDKDWIKNWRNLLKHPERVIILGKVDPFSVPELYRSVDVLLLPSMSEGMPNAAVEASACGIPVFASNVDGVPELVKHGVNGLLLPAGKEGNWARAISKYSGKKRELRQMGEKAREIVEERFDHKFFAKKIQKLYQMVLEGER